METKTKQKSIAGLAIVSLAGASYLAYNALKVQPLVPATKPIPHLPAYSWATNRVADLKYNTRLEGGTHWQSGLVFSIPSHMFPCKVNIECLSTNPWPAWCSVLQFDCELEQGNITNFGVAINWREANTPIYQVTYGRTN